MWSCSPCAISRLSSKRRGSSAQPGRRPMAHPTAASASAAERRTQCCRTGAIAARFTHKGPCYPAEHPAIIEEALFEEVQSILAANRTERVSRHHQDPSPLTGLLFDADGERLTPSHALKKGVRYRYYVSRNLITGDNTKSRGMRLEGLRVALGS